jgi:hypothetical protein
MTQQPLRPDLLAECQHHAPTTQEVCDGYITTRIGEDATQETEVKNTADQLYWYAVNKLDLARKNQLTLLDRANVRQSMITHGIEAEEIYDEMTLLLIVSAFLDEDWKIQGVSRRAWTDSTLPRHASATWRSRFESDIALWLAPIIPASMTYRNMVGELGFSEPVASFIGAAAVEFLGLSAINTAVEFWQYNEDKAARREARLAGLDDQKRAKAEKRKAIGAPLAMAVLTGGFYIAIVITVNAILDIGKADPVHVIAKILLSLLSVVAGVIIALRASHSRRLNPVKASPVQVQSKSESGRIEENSPKSKPSITYQKYVEMNAARNGEGAISAEDLLARYKMSRSTAFKWQGDYRESVGLDRRTGKPQVRA